MAKNEGKRLQSLEAKSENHADRIAKIEGWKDGYASTPGKGLNLGVLAPIVAAALLAYLGWLGIVVVQQGKDIAGIKQLLGPQVLAKAASNPEEPANIRQAAKIIETARLTNQKIGADIVAESGSEFIRASGHQPSAWKTAQMLVDYRTALNSVPPTPLPAQNLNNETTYFIIPSAIVGIKPDNVQGYGIAPVSESARLEPLGSTGTTVGGTGHALVVVEGGDILLDNTFVRSIVFRNSTIRYNGGPVRMENVYFVNCHFDVAPGQPTIDEFALAVLKSSPVDLRISN